MLVKNARPLPPYLAHGCGYGTSDLPPEGFRPEDMPEPSPKMLEMIRQDEVKKEARKPLAERFLSGSVTRGELTLPYRLYIPDGMEASAAYPMVVFLHGGGERGDDNVSHILANDGAVVWVRDQLEGSGEKCFVLAAQCPMGGPGWLEPALLALADAINGVGEKYPVDPDRLYLTGMSMGGGGCWRMNYMFPDAFAALVPICSACGLDEAGEEVDPNAVDAVAEAFFKKPLWIFHAADDMVVPPATSRSLVKALEVKGKKQGVDFFYTEYPAECGYNHGSWNPAYEWTIMRQWLFHQTRKPPVMPGPPAGAELPFSAEEMEKMMKLEQQKKEARKVWLSRFRSGSCDSPDVLVPYRLYVPEGKAEGLPLVVVLHGIGGCGCDNVGQITDNDGIIDWVRAQEKGLIPPCCIMAPQCPQPIPNNMWEIPYLTLVGKEVRRLISELAVDAGRVYLTGLSLGGYGSWNLNRMNPDLFAAVVTCCPACLAGDMVTARIDTDSIAACAPALLDKPLWMFHSEDDMAVPVEITKRMAAALRAAGKEEGESFHVTLYPAELHYNHGCWEPAYKDAEMLEWLFRQHK